MALVIRGLLLLLCADVTSAVSGKQDENHMIAISQSSAAVNFMKFTDPPKPGGKKPRRSFKAFMKDAAVSLTRTKVHQAEVVQVVKDMCEINCEEIANLVKGAEESKGKAMINLGLAGVGTLLGGLTMGTLTGMETLPAALYGLVVHGRGSFQAWKVQGPKMKTNIRAFFKSAQQKWTLARAKGIFTKIAPEEHGREEKESSQKEQAQDPSAEMCKKAESTSAELVKPDEDLVNIPPELFEEIKQAKKPKKHKKRNALAGFGSNNAGLALTCVSLTIMVAVTSGMVALTWPIALPLASAGLLVGASKMAVAGRQVRWSSNDKILFKKALSHCSAFKNLEPEDISKAFLEPGSPNRVSEKHSQPLPLVNP